MQIDAPWLPFVGSFYNVFTLYPPHFFRASSVLQGNACWRSELRPFREFLKASAAFLLPGSAESLLRLYTRNTLLLLTPLSPIHNNNTTTHATRGLHCARVGKLYRIRMRVDKRGGESVSGAVFVFHSITQNPPQQS